MRSQTMNVLAVAVAYECQSVSDGREETDVERQTDSVIR